MAKRPVTFDTTLNSTERIYYETTNTAGTPTAPGGSVSFRQVVPSGTDTTTTSGWTNPSTGVFYRDIAFSVLGVYALSAWAAGAEAMDYLITVGSALP